MRINNLRINSFGKLNNRDLEFGKFNLIYGDNEAGKSTLLNYIMHMFYGMNKSKSLKSNSDYDRFCPWNSNDFSGQINYDLDDGSNYRVYRDFGKKETYIYDKNNTEISNLFSVDKKCGNQFLLDQIKLDKNLLEKTFVINQNSLKVLKNEFNYNFSLEIEKKYLKTENINLHLKIDIDKDIILKTFPVKDALIFQEIKKELISDFDYNSIQKKVLASIFKDKKATLAVMEKGRGIRTIIETIKKYYLYKGKTISINDSSKKADFYIFTFDFENEVNLENIMQTLEKINSNNILVISNKEFELSNFNVIKDEYTVAKNIEYITYDEIDKIKKSDNFYYPFLTNEEKMKILTLLNKEEKIFSTKEIIVHF